MDLFSSNVVFRAQPNFLYSQALSSFFGKYYSGNKPRRRASLSALAGDSLGLVQQRRHLHSFIENRSFDFAYSADIHRRTDNGKGILENQVSKWIYPFRKEGAKIALFAGLAQCHGALQWLLYTIWKRECKCCLLSDQRDLKLKTFPVSGRYADDVVAFW